MRLRYGDTPTFLSVNQMISSYTLERSAELGLNLYGEEGAGDRAFIELLRAMRRLQVLGLLTVRLTQTKTGNHVFLGIVGGDTSASRQTAARVRRLLGMAPGAIEAEVVYGRKAAEPHQVAILTRPIIAVLSQVGAEISVPEQDVAAGRTVFVARSGRFGMVPVIAIHCGQVAPSNAYAAVRYGDAWFWIDRNDFNSKVAYTILELLMSLVEGAQSGGGAVLTIPTG